MLCTSRTPVSIQTREPIWSITCKNLEKILYTLKATELMDRLYHCVCYNQSGRMKLLTSKGELDIYNLDV